MHLAPTRQLHCKTSGLKKAVVEYVEGEKNTPYRCVTWYDGHVVMPYYCETEQEAIGHMNRFVENASS
jgi:hypothetical protein